MSESEGNLTPSKSVISVNLVNPVNNNNNENNTNNAFSKLDIFFQNQGDKEKILYEIYKSNRPLNYSELKEMTHVSNPSIIKQRNEDLFNESKEKGIIYLALSDYGKELIESIIKAYQFKNKKKEEIKTQDDMILEFKKFLETINKSTFKEGHVRGILDIDITSLREYNYDIYDKLLNEPEETIQLFKGALEDYSIEKLKLNLFNFPESCNLHVEDIRADHLNQLWAFDVFVKQLSEVRPQCIAAKFECPSCGTVISILQIERKFREPTRCSCSRKVGFKLISKDMVDSARALVEDIPGETSSSRFSKLSVFLKDNLVSKENINKIYPGSRIKIVGILKEVPVPIQSGGIQTRFDTALEAISIENSQVDIKLTKEDEKQILELSQRLSNPEKDEKGIKPLTDLAAPYIKYQDSVKEGLLCVAASGGNKFCSDGTIIKNTLNALVLGDPGIAKTKMSQAIANATPRSAYANAATASTVGLTASAVMDEYSKTWVIEGGLLVLHNNGMVIIDEVDKMDPENLLKMHEPMSEQTVTINKANIHATLPANTSVVMMANPKYGVFSNSSLHEQFNIPISLVNRCDLIFALRDNPDPEKDKKIAESILKRDQESKSNKAIEPTFLSKYMHKVHSIPMPIIDSTNHDLIISNYVGLRKRISSGIKTWVNARYVNAMISLCKAYARLRLSDKVEQIDFNRAKKLLEDSYDNLGVLSLEGSRQ